MVDAITGNSYGFSGSALVSGSTIKGSDSGPIAIEIGFSISGGSNITYRKTYFLFNIYDKEDYLKNKKSEVKNGI